MFEYYVYVYLNPLKKDNYVFGKFNFDYEPFYIGMGRNDRINQHISESKYEKKKTTKHYKILKILNNGLEPIRYKLYENITKESAERIEKYMIDLIGRRDLGFGPLCNLRNGGSGSNVVNEITKSKLSKLNKGKYGILNPNYGNRWSDEQKLIASIRQKEISNKDGYINPATSIEARKKISETKIGLKNPNGCLWKLISPNKEEIIVEGGIKNKLKEYNLTYTKMKWKVKNEIFHSKNGWIMYKIKK